MTIYRVIYSAAVDLLFKHGMHANDGFRQWFYDRNYHVSKTAQLAIDELIKKGKSAEEIFEALKNSRNTNSKPDQGEL